MSPNEWIKIWEPPFSAHVESLDNLDSAHDGSHIRRVLQNAMAIGAREEVDWHVLLPACWLHDCVCVAKDSPQRSEASKLAGREAVRLLKAWDYPERFHAAIEHAVAAHSFSARITPETIEAKVLRDADRLDAIGAIGIARLFATAGGMDSSLYHPESPVPCSRLLNDRDYAFDHFFAKLLKLPESMMTVTGREMAFDRAVFMSQFIERFVSEVDPDSLSDLRELQGNQPGVLRQ